jgi:hypothetical protein
MRRWLTVDWLTVLATVAGGAAALFGTLIAHILSSREDRRRENSSERRDSYVAYLVALDAAFGMVRRLADPHETPPDLAGRISQVFGDAGVYRSRERLLLAGNASVVSPAESALRRLGEMRDAVRDGAKRRTLPYHDAYHRYSEALWKLRMSIRKDLGSQVLAPAHVEKETWDSQANCEFCRTQRAAAGMPAQRVPAT